MRFERAGPRMFPWGMGEILNYSSDESTEIVLKDGRGRGGQVEGICLGGAGGVRATSRAPDLWGIQVLVLV